ncbi:hypothetical protein BDZ91DRAFT_758989 [Kalaharituber pfeilii]|nr:hypothetical protein BDZ91DRAFT_758989 [Kalaharituber pfeilii]
MDPPTPTTTPMMVFLVLADIPPRLSSFPLGVGVTTSVCVDDVYSVETTYDPDSLKVIVLISVTITVVLVVSRVEVSCVSEVEVSSGGAVLVGLTDVDDGGIVEDSEVLRVTVVVSSEVVLIVVVELDDTEVSWTEEDVVDVEEVEFRSSCLLSRTNPTISPTTLRSSLQFVENFEDGRDAWDNFGVLGREKRLSARAAAVLWGRLKDVDRSECSINKKRVCGVATGKGMPGGLTRKGGERIKQANYKACHWTQQMEGTRKQRERAWRSSKMERTQSNQSGISGAATGRAGFAGRERAATEGWGAGVKTAPAVGCGCFGLGGVPLQCQTPCSLVTKALNPSGYAYALKLASV